MFRFAPEGLRASIRAIQSKRAGKGERWEVSFGGKISNTQILNVNTKVSYITPFVGLVALRSSLIPCPRQNHTVGSGPSPFCLYRPAAPTFLSQHRGATRQPPHLGQARVEMWRVMGRTLEWRKNVSITEFSLLLRDLKLFLGRRSLPSPLNPENLDSCILVTFVTNWIRNYLSNITRNQEHRLCDLSCTSWVWWRFRQDIVVAH